MSSLATQLQGVASLDASRLTSRTGAPSSKSYLFPAKVAADHDLDTIYSLGLSGFEELLSLDPAFEEFEDALFSEHAKRTDRMLLNEEENKKLDVVLGRCLRRLGKWIGLMAGGRCVEWLVRRFRVHEMNAEVVLQVFMPYHSTPNFARILDILTLSKSSPYHAPFAPLVKDAQPIPRTYISSAISPQKDRSLRLAADVLGLVKRAQKEGVLYRALLSFWTGVIVDLLDQYQAGTTPSEGLVKLLIETFVDLLTAKGGGPDLNASVYPPLILLARTVRLADEVFLAILEAIITPNTGADAPQRILTLLVLLQDHGHWTSGLGSRGTDNLSKIKQLGQILLAAKARYGFEKGLSLVIQVMASRVDLFGPHLTQIVDESDLPASLAGVMAAGIASAQTEDAMSLLSKLREKYPLAVDKVVFSLPNGSSSTPAKTQDGTGLFEADISARVQAISQLLEGNADDRDVREAVLNRLGDDEPEIIAAIYKHRERLAGMFKDDAAYLDAVSAEFTGLKQNPKIVHLHLDFICKHFASSSDAQLDVFERIIVPHLLPAKQAHSFDAKAWDIVLGSSIGRSGPLAGLSTHELSQPINPNSAKEISLRIATAIHGSQSEERLSTFLVSQLGSDSSAPRLLASLVLVHSITISASVDLGARILSRLQSFLSNGKLQDLGEASDPLSPLLLRDICERPDDRNTGIRANLALFAAVSRIPRPKTATIQLYTMGSQAETYKTLATNLYTLVNSDILPSHLAQSVLRFLLTQLKDDALIVFAYIWTSGHRHARLAALKHALGFIQAYATLTQQTVDFQMVIPSLLIALQDNVKEIRSAAVAVLKKIGSLVEKGGTEIYALDTIYGSRSDLVQLLRHADLQSYLQALISVSHEMVLDPARVKRLHVEHLGAQQSGSRKNTAHRRAVIKALLSHVVAWRRIDARLALLSTLENVIDSTLFSGALPLLKTDLEREWTNGLEADIRTVYLGLLFKMLNRRTAARFTEDDLGWVYLRELFTEANDLAAPVKITALRRLRDGVFDSLSGEQKISLVETLLDSMHNEDLDDSTEIREALSSFQLDSGALQDLIHSLAQSLEISSHRKKQKQDNKNQAEKAEQAVEDLTTLIDSRGWRSLSGPAAPLVATLMSVLSSILAKRSSVKKGIDYLEQEILDAVLILLESIHDAEELHKAHVGIEVIIKVIRASNNPRTSQRALLVISELARFIPEAVLHNVMPIFTFMGASDFQRDDAYSFSVVEKTISKIVPVLTASLKAKDMDPLEMYKEAMPILSIFTDMAGRLPRHRTLPFFVHLVRSLEPGYFLAPVSMLLVDRTTTKAGRGGLTASQALDLPIGVTTSFYIDDQLFVVKQTLEEVGRLYSDPETAFVSHNNQDNLTERTTKQINALLTFCGTILEHLARKSCDQSTIEDIVSALVVLAGSKRDGVTTVEPTLAASMQLLSADNFLKVISSAVQSSDPSTAEMGLGVFVQRLPMIKSEVRTRNNSIIGEIVQSSGGKLLDPTLAEPTLLALQTVISSSMRDASENASFAQIVPSVLAALQSFQSKSLIIASLELLGELIKKLESRIIPSIQGIIDVSLSSLQLSSESIMRQTSKVLGTLFDTVPTFVSSKQLTAVLQTTLEHHSRDAEIMKGLMSGITKKVQTKTLFPIVLDIWKSIKEDRLVAFFELLRLTLRHADRQALAGLTKRSFSFFLEAFDLPWKPDSKGFDGDTIEAVGASAISSFLEMVTKLNEVTFRPLFTRLFDWAVIDLDGQDDTHLNARKKVLFKVMLGLLQRFKNLLSPYIGILLPHIQELLASYAAGEATDPAVWTLMLDALSKSFEVDDGAYWSDSSLLKIILPIVSQLASPLGVQLREGADAPSPVVQCLAALAASTTSETVLKSLNTSICLQTRDDDPKVRMIALHAVQGIWEVQGEELTAFVQETVGEYLSELLEDEHSDVISLARKVLGTIEGATGAGVEEYLD